MIATVDGAVGQGALHHREGAAEVLQQRCFSASARAPTSTNPPRPQLALQPAPKSLGHEAALCSPVGSIAPHEQDGQPGRLKLSR